MLVLPYLLREDAKKIFRNFGEENFAQIVCGSEVLEIADVVSSETYTVIIDGNKMDSTNSLVVAIEVVFALHYIFNLAYPKSLESFFTFIQKQFVNLQDNAVPNSKVLNLITKLRWFGFILSYLKGINFRND